MLFRRVVIIQRRAGTLRWTGSRCMRNFFIVRSKQDLIIIPGFGIKESGDGNIIFYKV